LGSCIPTRDGHFYSLEIISACDPIGWSVLLLPKQQHHLYHITLTSYMPVSLFSHSQCCVQQI